MKVLVIGAAGQLGQDLMKTFGEDAIGLGHGDIDVTDGVGVSRIVREHAPDWVINTAAFHRVDDCELNPTLAFAVNATGAAMWRAPPLRSMPASSSTPPTMCWRRGAAPARSPCGIESA
jgi:hypothetical protein